MHTVDSRNNWKIIDKMIDAEQNDWRKTMLLQLKEHMQAECGGNLQALLGTLVEDPQFHNWEGANDKGPKGIEALTEFYSGLIGSGANRFEYAIERIVIGDDILVTEGEIRVPFSGEMLQAMGREDAKAGAFYATHGRAVTFWPFSKDGKIIGEDIYNMTSDVSEAEEIELKPYIYGEAS